MKRYNSVVLVVLAPIIWCVVLASATGAIYLKHRSRQLFVILEKSNSERDRLEIEWGQLQLEQSSWSTNAFVENVASANLSMRIPPPEQIQVVTE